MLGPNTPSTPEGNDSLVPTALLLEGTGSIAHDADRKTFPIDDDEQSGTARGQWRNARKGALSISACPGVASQLTNGNRDVPSSLCSRCPYSSNLGPCRR